VPYILGYAGHGAIGLLDGIVKVKDRIRHISPRVEAAAGFMADVYYRLTGQPLVVYASTGPGPMNLMIATANAYYDNSAFFVITGNVPTTQLNSGALQDDYRYNGTMSSIFTPVTKKSFRVDKVGSRPGVARSVRADEEQATRTRPHGHAQPVHRDGAHLDAGATLQWRGLELANASLRLDRRART
jgi:acetolactate synthase-1/2/3 large subunit